MSPWRMPFNLSWPEFHRPGATGLTKSAAGADLTGAGLSAFVGALVAIALGVLTGTAVYRQIFRVAPSRWKLRLV